MSQGKWYPDRPRIDEVAAAKRQAAAVSYAERDWYVVPLHGVRGSDCTCKAGRVCKSAGKHPFAKLAPHGYRDGSRYRATVEFWFTTYPWMNIGIALGPSGLIVLDVDPRNGGDDSMKKLLGHITAMPDTLVADTGGGGQHYYFTDHDRTGRSWLLDSGLEVKAAGSLVVAAPSLHRRGHPYRWRDESATIAPMPTWMARP